MKEFIKMVIAETNAFILYLITTIKSLNTAVLNITAGCLTDQTYDYFNTAGINLEILLAYFILVS